MKRIALFLTVVLASIVAVHADYDAEAAARKADLYFMEGMRQRALGNEDAHYNLLSRAYELTPDKSGREAYEVGVRKLYFADLESDSIGEAEALKMISGYFEANPGDIYAGSMLANVYVRQGDIDRAFSIYETMEEQKPNNVTLVGNHADLLMRGERFDEAVALYKRLEKSAGKSVAMTQRISNIRVWQGDTVGAFAEIDSLIASQPRNIEALHLAASAASAFGYPEMALTYLDRAKSIDPTNGTTYYYAADAYKALGREQEYVEALLGAIKGDDLAYEAKIELLRFYVFELMEGEEGKEMLASIFESLVKQYPHEYQVRKWYSSYYADLKQWDAAAEQLSLAIDANPTQIEDYELLARLEYTAGNIPRAIRALERGVEQAPENIELRELMYAIYVADEDFDSAIKVLESALELPNLTDLARSKLYCNFADLLQNIKGKDAEVKDYYEKALEADFANSLAMNNYAYYLSTHGGDLLRAKELIARAVLYNSGSATYYDTYAWVMFKLGDLQEAKHYIDLAILSENDSESGDIAEVPDEILEHAAQIYEALGQPDKAQEYRKRMVGNIL